MAELRVRLTPRADRDAIAGVRDGVVQVRVSAPPVDGKANAALCKLLAKQLGVPRTSVEVVRGQGAREKVVRVDGLDDDELRARVDAAAG